MAVNTRVEPESFIWWGVSPSPVLSCAKKENRNKGFGQQEANRLQPNKALSSTSQTLPIGKYVLRNRFWRQPYPAIAFLLLILGDKVTQFRSPRKTVTLHGKLEGSPYSCLPAWLHCAPPSCSFDLKSRSMMEWVQSRVEWWARVSNAEIHHSFCFLFCSVLLFPFESKVWKEKQWKQQEVTPLRQPPQLVSWMTWPCWVWYQSSINGSQTVSCGCQPWNQPGELCNRWKNQSPYTMYIEF